MEMEMLKREAIRAVSYLWHRNAIDPARTSFVLKSTNETSVLDEKHLDPLYYRGVTLYFGDKGKEITKDQFDRLQAKADAVEAYLHPTPVRRRTGGPVMLTKMIVSGDLGLFTKGQVLSDRNTIGEYIRTSLNEGRVGPEIGEDEVANILAHADELNFESIENEDDEINLNIHITKYYPDMVRGETV